MRLTLILLLLTAAGPACAAPPKAAPRKPSGAAAKPAAGVELPSKARPGSVVAQVNGVKIPLSEYIDRLSLEFGPQIREVLVMEALIRQSAKQRKLSATPAEIERFLERTLDQLAQRYGGEQGLAAELKRVRGWTLAEYRGVLRSQTEVQVLREKLAESLVPASAVTEIQVAERYAARKESFSQPDRVRVSHILVRRPSDPAQASAALARAERTLARIVEAKGANFDALAAQLSEDEVTAKVGGKITTDIVRGAHPFGEGFEAAVFGGEPGIIPQVVTSSMGHHIFRLDRKMPGRTLPLEEVKEQIHASLLAERRAEKLDEHLIAVRARADVVLGRY